MGKLIPEEIVEEVKNSADIVSVIGDYVSLKSKGNRYWGLCPFHAEDTPSFSVNPEKGFFYCFGCNTGGNVFKFVMLQEKLTFPEAVKLLADRSGVTIPEDDYLSPEQQKKERAYQANETAMQFYQYMLTKHEAGQAARDYLVQRGLTAETIADFKLGYAPANWDTLTKVLLKKGFSKAELVKWGLSLEGRTQKLYDRFRNRIIFPITNVRGKVVAFGGRVMDDSLPKYLNSAESEIFSKAHNLYGLNLATSAIREAGRAVMVEGYLDVISAHQAGLKNVVASLGTAMTKEHAQLIMRYTDEVVLAYDADPAGQKAALRGMDILQEAGCRVKIAVVPEGKDPDEFIKNHGAAQFDQLVSHQAQSLIAFKINQIKAKYDFTTTGGKVKVLNEVLPNLDRVQSAVEREEYLQTLGTELNLSWETIQSELDLYRREQLKKSPARDKNVKKRYNNLNNGDYAVSAPPRPPKAQHSAVERAEETLVRFMVDNSAYLQKTLSRLDIDAFQEPVHQTIIKRLQEIAQTQGSYNLSSLSLDTEDAALSNRLARILVAEMPLDHPEQVFEDCVQTLQEASLKRKKDQLLKAMTVAEKQGDLVKVNQLLQEMKQLM